MNTITPDQFEIIGDDSLTIIHHPTKLRMSSYKFDDPDDMSFHIHNVVQNDHDFDLNEVMRIGLEILKKHHS